MIDHNAILIVYRMHHEDEVLASGSLKISYVFTNEKIWNSADLEELYLEYGYLVTEKDVLFETIEELKNFSNFLAEKLTKKYYNLVTTTALNKWIIQANKIGELENFFEVQKKSKNKVYTEGKKGILERILSF
ncbi:MAG: hypothetical protein H6621_01075 [Halobacteriovoraceae bacterium]|nr:hypothetical protein [Halobacteriovoraceae bacterium]MCB9093634.1 hypothetical protein [Halobacteriovoraceae bacterium]